MKRDALDRASFLWIAAAVSAALLPVLPAFPGWLAAFLVAIIALGIGLGLRRRRLPTLLRLILTLATAVAAVVGSGFSVSQDTGAALLAAMLASKLLETGSVRDGRSACSFALFAVMAGFLRDQGPLTLFLALGASLLVLTALARLARIELPGQPPAPTPLRALTASAKLLAISLPFAAVTFFLFPRFPEPLWGSPGPEDRARTGLSNDMSPGDIVEMLLDDSPALRVTFEGEPPPASAMYWRGPVLSDFDGRRWSRWEGDAFGTKPEIEAHGPTLFHEVMQEPTTYRYLIGLDVPTVAPQGSRIGPGHTVYAARLSRSVRQFRIGSALDYRLEPELPGQQRQHQLRLPEGYNPQTRQLMAQWKAEDARPEALIQRALALFNRSFTYSLTPPPLARDSVDDFLFATREGYCEHFASAFAVMMRAAGVPARVVTGYQGGFHNRIGDYWLVRNSDAHAWTEVWLEGRGWVRVDPTAAVAPERIRDGLSGVIPPPGALSRFGEPLWNLVDAMRRGWNFVIVDFNAARQRELLRKLGLDMDDWRQLGVVLIAAIALSLALSFALLWRAGPGGTRDPLLAAWQVLCRRLAAAGVAKAAAETPDRFIARAALALPEEAAQLHALSARYVAQRYADGLRDPPEIRALIRALRQFRPRTHAARRAP
ncbi:MAG TPA: DUF3488 and transglutaminase-like domain-containing protein [Chiayiivirga sp.]|nr:DUF3488 and transglutaminase-like domain-containing protein [Chiayiivirga sp.]